MTLALDAWVIIHFVTQTGFGWIVLGVAVYGLLHSWLASQGVKAWAEARLGLNARRFYRLGYVLVSGAALLPLGAMARLLPDQPLYSIPFPLTLLALGLQVASAFGILVAVSQTGTLSFLGLSQVGQPEALLPAGTAQLVTAGLYRVVRHPIYLFSLLALWCTPQVSWNTLALLVGLTLYLLVGALFEERKLVLEFGEAYRAYRRTTPMILPRFWR